jgi:phosphoribosylformylglycinamidine cyclo-ligase
LITPPESGLSYASAGVDIDAYNRVLEQMKALVERTHGREVTAGVGPFAGIYELPGGSGHLAASTDGVGTKIKVAIAARRHRGIGVDLVNHCVNDIATAGARPLFLLDYFACGRLDESVLLEVAAGISEACLKEGCALLGGETAEMPGMYALGDYDLAGFVVGLIEPGRLPDVSRVRSGDLLFAKASSGLHTNGYSLARRVFDEVPLDHVFPELGISLVDALLEAHKSYAGELRALSPRWKSAAHITGGGLIGNAARALPADLAALFHRAAWRVPPLFRLIQERGRIEDEEMLGTFNMGLGMVITVDPADADAVSEQGWLRVGEVVEPRVRARVLFD